MKNIVGFITLLLFGVVFFFACDQKEDAVKPVAGFTLAQDEVFIGEAVEITNTSKDAAYYSWDFGNGTYSSETNPELVYTTANVYTIKLEALNKGESDTYTKQITVLEPSTGTITVTTTTPSQIKAFSAISGGAIINNSDNESVRVKGVCWSTSKNPTLDNKIGATADGDGNESFVSLISDLNPLTTYYVIAYAITNNDEAIYGNQVNFTTKEQLGTEPVIEDGWMSQIYDVNAVYSGFVAEIGGEATSDIGVCWNTTRVPKISNSLASSGSVSSGSFECELKNLESNTIYYVRPYIKAGNEVYYGNELMFTTCFMEWNYEPKSLAIDFTVIAPRIDGEIDDMWLDVPVNNVNRLGAGYNVSLGEGATFRSVWDDNYIYFLFEVPDDNFYPHNDTGGEIFNTDRTVLLFDVNETLQDGVGPAVNESGHFELSNDESESIWLGSSNSSGNLNHMAFKVSNDSYYVVEYAVSFDELVDVDGMQLDPYNRSTIGFDAIVTDKDEPGLGWSESVGNVNWSNCVTINWANMDNAGKLTFTGGNSNETVVIFDPETYDETILPEGMEIVEIDGVFYLQIVTDGWNMELDIPDVALTVGQTVSAETKYVMGKGTALMGTPLDSIQFNCQIKDLDNLIEVNWDPNPVPAFVDLKEEGATEEMGLRSGVVADPMDNAQIIAFWAQLMVGDWPSTFGDTIWVGKITAQ